MIETCELRVLEEFANLLFASDEGKRLGTSIRCVKLRTDDPKFTEVRRISENLKLEGKYFFHGWHLSRKYSQSEIRAARLFQLIPTAFFEPDGEQCGTIYDDASACPACCAGAPQTSDLRLDFRKIPRNKDIATTIANEIVVSQRLAQLLMDAGISGFSARPARHKARYEDDPLDFSQTPSGRILIEQAKGIGLSPGNGRFCIWLNRPELAELVMSAREENAERLARLASQRGRTWPVWHQLVVDSRPVSVAPVTHFGCGLFDADEKGQYRCRFGHLLGLNLLSEVSILEADWDGSDFVRTAQFVGVRRGQLRPRNMLLVSQKVRQVFTEHKIKGAEFEVAHLA
jgi:hypothetical protein